ncbi:MAG: hypothetical protein BWY31_04160 [Lentisphaerae bacterium ADurb.Bin242]|nr:MAG: hypothetical protein BWY31_04160 [Lentisphaerae bacterium ADurb.Bin242]
MKQVSWKTVRILFGMTVCMLAFLSTSCGYRVGSLMHPQIKTVAIADVKNDTTEVLAATVMRKLLAERFQFDNSLKVVSLDKADCIVYCRIVGVQNLGVTWESYDNDQTFRPSEFKLTVSVEFSVQIPGQSVPMVPLRPVSGTATYQFTSDPAIGREGGLQQACLKIANSIVSSTTEAW